MAVPDVSPGPAAGAGPGACAGVTSLLLTAGHLLELRLDQALGAVGLTARQHRALRHIADHPGVSRTELADALQISPQAAGGLCQRMWAAGHIDRTWSGPGLPMSFVITDTGGRCLDAASVVVNRAERRMVAGLSRRASASLVAALSELIGQAH